MISFAAEDVVKKLKDRIKADFRNCFVLFDDFSPGDGSNPREEKTVGNILCKFFVTDSTGIDQLRSQIQSFSFEIPGRQVKFIDDPHFSPRNCHFKVILFDPLGPPTPELAQKIQSYTDRNSKIILDQKLLYVLAKEPDFNLPDALEFHLNGKSFSAFLVLDFDPLRGFPIAHCHEDLDIEKIKRTYPHWVDERNSETLKDHLGLISPFRSVRDSEGTYFNSMRLINVIAQVGTIKAINARSFTSPNGYRYLLRPQELTNTMYRFEDLFNRVDSPVKNQYTSLIIREEDCLEVAQSLGPRTAVLNMANEHHPGGGYKKGATAQEQSLFRRTTLSAALDPNFVGIKHRESFNAPRYPWNFDVIVTENVEVFRKSEFASEALSFFNPSPNKISVISTAAPQNPPVVHFDSSISDYQNDSHRQIMFRRWNCVFLSAIKHGIDSLVISPLGCDAFHNPVEAVCMIIVLMEFFYAKFFKSLTLSVIGDNFSICNSFLSNYRQRVNHMNPVTTPRVCRFLSECRDLYSEDHTYRFSHPPFCKVGNCSLEGSHAAFACHIPYCDRAHDCVNRDDKEHSAKYKHHTMCSSFMCTDFSIEHRSKFWHSPLCPKGYSCPKKDTGCKFSHKL
ncbi:hypothetical protein RCL1_008593 [Eukaryota sp. TZLM3-RCL]